MSRFLGIVPPFDLFTAALLFFTFADTSDIDERKANLFCQVIRRAGPKDNAIIHTYGMRVASYEIEYHNYG